MSKHKLEGLFDYGGSDEEDINFSETDEQGTAAGAGVVFIHSDDEPVEPAQDTVLGLFDESEPSYANQVDGGSVVHVDGSLQIKQSSDVDNQELQAILQELPADVIEPPQEEPSPSAQTQVALLYEGQRKTGLFVSAEIRRNRDYRNPDFLQKMVDHFKIQEYGSNFSKEVFDPYNFPREDFYDELTKEWHKEEERRRTERQKNQRIDFVKSASQPDFLNNPFLPGLNVKRPLVSTQVQQLAANLSKGSRWDTSQRALK